MCEPNLFRENVGFNNCWNNISLNNRQRFIRLQWLSDTHYSDSETTIEGNEDMQAAKGLFLNERGPPSV